MKIEQVTTTYKTLTLTENELRETAIDYIRNAISYTESENYKLAFFCYNLRRKTHGQARGSSQKTSKSALEARDKLLKKLAKDKFYEHTLTMVAIEVVE